MFVSVLTLFLTLRRLGLEVKMFPRHARVEKRAGCESQPLADRSKRPSLAARLRFGGAILRGAHTLPPSNSSPAPKCSRHHNERNELDRILRCVHIPPVPTDALPRNPAQGDRRWRCCSARGHAAVLQWLRFGSFGGQNHNNHNHNQKGKELWEAYLNKSMQESGLAYSWK